MWLLSIITQKLILTYRKLIIANHKIKLIKLILFLNRVMKFTNNYNFIYKRLTINESSLL